MDTSEKQWFVMRDLRRRTSNTLAIHELAEAGLEVFTPMTQMIMTIRGRRQRREVPVIQDLLFVNESKDVLDAIVAKFPSLQYRYQLGKSIHEPMTVRSQDMKKFLLAVSQTESTIYYMPGELTKAMYGKKVRIIGGLLDAFEGRLLSVRGMRKRRLLSVRGMRKRRLLVELPNLITAAVEVEPEFIQLV